MILIKIKKGILCEAGTFMHCRAYFWHFMHVIASCMKVSFLQMVTFFPIFYMLLCIFAIFLYFLLCFFLFYLFLKKWSFCFYVLEYEECYHYVHVLYNFIVYICMYKQVYAILRSHSNKVLLI